MSDKNMFSNNPNCKETVCIDTNKIFDSCRDKDCLEDLRVFLTDYSQEIIDRATSIRCKESEVIAVNVNVEPIAFNRGFFSIDIRFFFRVVFDACICMGRQQEIEGIAIFDKRVILFGSEGNVKIFRSEPGDDNFCRINPEDIEMKSNLPTAVVEVVDPICLSAKICDADVKTGCSPIRGIDAIPDHVHKQMKGKLVDDGCKRLFVTLGLFSIVRIERPVQLIINATEFCVPEKECIPCGEEDPCSLFKKMKFPVAEFCPPSISQADFDRDFGSSDRDRDDRRCACGK